MCGRPRETPRILDQPWISASSAATRESESANGKYTSLFLSPSHSLCHSAFQIDTVNIFKQTNKQKTALRIGTSRLSLRLWKKLIGRWYWHWDLKEVSKIVPSKWVQAWNWGIMNWKSKNSCFNMKNKSLVTWRHFVAKRSDPNLPSQSPVSSRASFRKETICQVL